MQIRLFEFLASFALMLVIFLASSEPTADSQRFDLVEKITRKGGHVIGYCLLAISYYYSLGAKEGRRWLAWLLAVIYGITDEFHQSFVPGRDPSIWDVIIFDNIGALIGIWIVNRRAKRKQSARAHNVKT